MAQYLNVRQHKLGTTIIQTVHILPRHSADTGSLPMDEEFLHGQLKLLLINLAGSTTVTPLHQSRRQKLIFLNFFTILMNLWILWINFLCDGVLVGGWGDLLRDLPPGVPRPVPAAGGQPSRGLGLHGVRPRHDGRQHGDALARYAPPHHRSAVHAAQARAVAHEKRDECRAVFEAGWSPPVPRL